jgi:hypothetical protein
MCNKYTNLFFTKNKSSETELLFYRSLKNFLIENHDPWSGVKGPHSATAQFSTKHN